jgi:hypothetical protein
MKNLFEDYEKYKLEINEDVKVDQLNLLERQMQHPAIRHKWVSRLIQHKKNKIDLERKKKKLKQDVLKNFTESDIPKGIPKSILNDKVESSEIIQKINQEIEDSNLLIDYLERVEKIFSSMSYDFGSINNTIKMEMT